MLVVTVELHSAVTHEVKLLHKVIIANEGTSANGETADYGVYVGREGDANLKSVYTRPMRRGKVLRHFRNRAPVLNLVRKALFECFSLK